MRLINAATVPRAEKILRRAICPAAVVVGTCVKVVGPKVGVLLQVDTADSSVSPFVPAVGVVVRKYDATTCLVQAVGPVAGVYAGLTPGAPYYLGTSGALVATPPLSPAHIQQMGIALDTDELLLQNLDEGALAAAVEFDVNRILTVRLNPHDPPVHEEPSVVIERSSGNVMVRHA